MAVDGFLLVVLLFFTVSKYRGGFYAGIALYIAIYFGGRGRRTEFLMDYDDATLRRGCLPVFLVLIPVAVCLGSLFLEV